MPNRTLVPDKLQGYLLQVRHMLYELISVDDRIVSIEKLDDVAVEADGKVIAEQVKSVTSANNPIAERSSVFWKLFIIGVLISRLGLYRLEPLCAL